MNIGINSNLYFDSFNFEIVLFPTGRKVDTASSTSFAGEN